MRNGTDIVFNRMHYIVYWKDGIIMDVTMKYSVVSIVHNMTLSQRDLLSIISTKKRVEISELK